MSKIEQVARALAVERWGDADEYNSLAPALRNWEVCIDEAKAAIEAMREPTDNMRAAVAAQWGRKTWGYYNDVIDAALNNKETSLPTDKWQPIETAPSNKLIILCTRGVENSADSGVVYKRTSDKAVIGTSTLASGTPATDWMPLPQTPKRKSK